MMLPHIAEKLREAELALDFRLPKKVFDLIRKLQEPEYKFSHETWLFPSVISDDLNDNANFILEESLQLNQYWDLDSFVFSKNSQGNLLFLLKNDEGVLLKEIFIFLKSKLEIKIFNHTLEKLLSQGPLDYMLWDNYYFKKIEDKIFKGDEYPDEN